jgi:hypothetical protein
MSYIRPKLFIITQAKYWINPQYLIKINDVDHYDNESKATVIVALMQKDSRLKRIKTKAESAEEFIQFRLYKVMKSNFLTTRLYIETLR